MVNISEHESTPEDQLALWGSVALLFGFKSPAAPLLEFSMELTRHRPAQQFASLPHHDAAWKRLAGMSRQRWTAARIAGAAVLGMTMFVGSRRKRRGRNRGNDIAGCDGSPRPDTRCLRRYRRTAWGHSHAGVSQSAGTLDRRVGAASPNLNSNPRMLAVRFLQVAQPYFLPTDQQSDGLRWLRLLTALIVGVVSSALLVTFALASLAGVLYPTLLSQDAMSTLAALANLPILRAASVGLMFAGMIVWLHRRDLAGREWQWSLLALLLLLLFCVTGLKVLLSYVFRTIDNVLLTKDAAAFYSQIISFAVVMTVAVPVIGGYRLTRLMLARDWRSFLTRFFLQKYLANRAYYALDSNSVKAGGIDNPDQRITEDIDFFTRETLDFLLDVLDSVLNLFSFAAILWVTSRALTLSLVVYAMIGTLIALAAGSQLVRINALHLREEANLRYSLVHIRDNAEAIAFYGGEARERGNVETRLNTLLENLTQLINYTTGLSIYQQAFFYLARMVPYMVIGGLYLAGEVDFGTLGQGTFAFNMVLSSVTLIVSRIQEISRFSAGIHRLGAFLEVLDSPGGLAQAGGKITSITADDGRVEVKSLTVETPDGCRPLVCGLDILLGHGDGPTRLLVVGASGVGKSSMLRAIAGLWERGQGVVARPSPGEAMFLPQRPYMPLGDLREQLLYPDSATSANNGDQELHAVLDRLGLGALPARFEGGLDAVCDWGRTLSLGEQQRLAAARCLLRRPKVAVLDEATSALPVQDERKLYDRFREMGIRYISVGHRASLLHYHDSVLELSGNGEWRLLSSAAYAQEAGGIL